jgi:hypothetical protein
VTFEDHIELLLDEALEATFPASDPVALAVATDLGAAWRRFASTDSMSTLSVPSVLFHANVTGLSPGASDCPYGNIFEQSSGCFLVSS